MSREQKNILVVEDNLETQLIIKVALRDDYKFEMTSNADEAIQLLDSCSFDLMLLDLNLNGEGSGKDILVFLREKSSKNEFPVIVMTAYDLSEDEKQFFNENANGFIPKPIDKNIIHSVVDKTLNNS